MAGIYGTRQPDIPEIQIAPGGTHPPGPVTTIQGRDNPLPIPPYRTDGKMSNQSGHRMVLTDKAWENMTPENRDWMIFSTLNSMDKRLESLECRKKYDKCWSFFGGILGGLAATLGIRWGA